MRTLTLNETQLVGGGDLPKAPDVFSTGDILHTLENNPVGVATGMALGQLAYNFAGAVQFGFTAIIWSVHQLAC